MYGKIKKTIILIINIVAIFLILNSIIIKEKPINFVSAIPIVPATIAGDPCDISHTCGFSEWGYNSNETIPPNVNVYVKEGVEWMIGQQCDMIPIKVKIDVW